MVGAGAYVTGRGTGGPGTVLPALAEVSRTLPLAEVTLCATREDGEGEAETAAAADRVNQALGTSLRVRYRRAAPLLAGAELADFDAAIVAVPDHLHAEVGRRVLAAGLHCLMVKPLTPGLAEGRELARLAAERRLHAVVEFHKRYDEANLVVRRLLGENRLGRLSYATVEYSQRISVPLETFRGWAHRTNIFQYLGVHYVDLLYFLTGYRPLDVLAVGSRGVLSAAGVDTFDAVHALTRWASPDGGDPFVCHLATAWIDPGTSTAMSDQRYRIVGAAGRVDCDQKNRGVEVVTGEGGVEAINPYFSQLLATGDGPRFDGYGHRSIATFLTDVAAISRGEATPEALAGRRPTFAEGLVSTAVVDAVNRSLATARPGRRWMRRFDPRSLEPLLAETLAARGVAEESRRHVAASLVETSLRGVDSHGINLFPHYARAATAGRINPRPTLTVPRRGAATAVLDADHAFGHHAGSAAMELACELADAAGIGTVAVRNSTHFGAAAYFALPASRRGYLAGAFTNADALVRAFGGVAPFFGSNPICVTAPMAGEEPFCLDMATATVSWNRVLNHRRAGLPLSSGWAADAAGADTTDAGAAAMLQPVGGYKGFGLGMVVEILCALLADGPAGPDILPMFTAPLTAKRHLSHFFVAVRVDAFVAAERFAERLADLARRLRAAPAAAGNAAGVLVPGDPEKRSFAERSVRRHPRRRTQARRVPRPRPGLRRSPAALNR